LCKDFVSTPPETRPILGREGELPQRRKQVLLSKKEIGLRVRTLRKESGMTQLELAQALGTHQTSLSQIERGIRGVGVKQILRLSSALRVSADKLLVPAAAREGPLPPRNEKLLRRVRSIEKLPAEHQEAVVRMIDAFLDTQRRSNGRR
jgi:transcriptional regulator with XRE-family HTH domain